MKWSSQSWAVLVSSNEAGQTYAKDLKSVGPLSERHHDIRARHCTFTRSYEYKTRHIQQIIHTHIHTLPICLSNSVTPIMSVSLKHVNTPPWEPWCTPHNNTHHGSVYNTIHTSKKSKAKLMNLQVHKVFPTLTYSLRTLTLDAKKCGQKLYKSNYDIIYVQSSHMTHTDHIT